ncbi:MAG: CvpA family protein [Actinobacteria bacterium]|nr:CvpA family protein [Actinomycetota bacterium]
MNRSLILDLVVVSTVVVASARGWARKSIREAFALVGIVAGILLVALGTGLVAAVVRAVSPAEPGASRAIAAVTLFAVAWLVGTIVGYRTARSTMIPGPRLLDSIGGAMFALVRILVVVSLGLFSLDVLWGPQSDGHRMIADSVSGKFLAGDESPFGTFYASLVDESEELSALRAWAEPDEVRTAGYQQTNFEATDERLVLRRDSEREMLRAINDERRKRGLDLLRWCNSCAEVARSHSEDMYRGGYFSHEDLDGDDPFDRMVDAGISYGAAGENLALAPTIEEAHAGLMKSPDHRANILRDEFDQVGIGVYEGPYGLMCTQVFRALP